MACHGAAVRDGRHQNDIDSRAVEYSRTARRIPHGNSQGSPSKSRGWCFQGHGWGLRIGDMSDQRTSSESGCGLAAAIAAVGLIVILMLAGLAGSFLYVQQKRMQVQREATLAAMRAQEMALRAQAEARVQEQQAAESLRLAERRAAAASGAGNTVAGSTDAGNSDADNSDAGRSTAGPLDNIGWQVGQTVELRQGARVQRAKIVERRSDGQLLLRLHPPDDVEGDSGEGAEQVSDNVPAVVPDVDSGEGSYKLPDAVDSGAPSDVVEPAGP
jgi:hypothetical protein